MRYTRTTFAIAAAMIAALLAPTGAQATTCSDRDPLSSTYMSAWRQAYGAYSYQIAVYDLTTGCQYVAADTSKSFQTASTVKLAIAVGIMEGVSAGKYSWASVRSDMTAMITVSSNTAASRLYRKIGRGTGIKRVASHYGMVGTAPGRSWGVTKTTALDQVRLMNRALAKTNPRISSGNRTRLLALMKRVTPTQHWGAGGGIPTGWTSAVKNGWYPTVAGDEPPVGRWRLNTVGMVYDASGKPRWIMAGYSNTWRTQSQGIRAWNSVTRQLVRTLGS